MQTQKHRSIIKYNKRNLNSSEFKIIQTNFFLSFFHRELKSNSEVKVSFMCSCFMGEKVDFMMLSENWGNKKSYLTLGYVGLGTSLASYPTRKKENF